MAPKKNESDASGKKKDQTKAAAKSKGKGKKSGKDKKAGFRDDVAMDPMEEIRAQPMGNYTQCRERATLLEETFLREKQQYQPDSALLTLSAFESGNVFIDPYDVDLTKQANALVWKDREDVNQIGYKQMTPVWMCARMGNLPMAAYLMERNADVNMPDDEGVSPLHIAIMKGQRESIVHQLVGRTGSIDLIEQKTQAGWTPLQLCVVNCPEPSNLELIRLLLKLKADVLATNEIQSQDTAIHLAVREPRGENYEEVLEYLMFYLYKQTLALEEQGDKEGAKKMMNPQVGRSFSLFLNDRAADLRSSVTS